MLVVHDARSIRPRKLSSIRRCETSGPRICEASYTIYLLVCSRNEIPRQDIRAPIYFTASSGLIPLVVTNTDGEP